MTIKNTKLNALRDYINDFLDTRNKDEWTSVDWLDDKEINFSITPLPMANNGYISQDILGNKRFMYSIQHSVVFTYSNDVAEMIENSDYFEQLEDWVNDQNKSNSFPNIDGAYEVRITQSPFLFNTTENNQNAQYTITLTTYYKKEN